jgi:hypothetical protein
MKPTSLLFFLLVLFSALPAFSQDSREDVVYMNNGSFLRGKIVQMEPGKMLKLLVDNKDTIEIPVSEVKLVREENAITGTGNIYENGFRSWGYSCIMELNLGIGLLEGLDRYKDTAYTQYSLLISASNGFELSPYIYLGIGVGLEVWRSRLFLPLYLDFRSNLLKTDNSPFLYVNAGYALGGIVGQRGAGLGGAMAGLGGGAKFRFSKRLVMVVSLGYRFQQTGEWLEYHNVRSKATRDGHFITLKTGLIL